MTVLHVTICPFKSELAYNGRYVIPEIISISYVVSYKTINNERIEQGYCYVFDIIFVVTIVHYIATNKSFIE